MCLVFKPENHEYVSIDGSEIKWVSATSFIGNFKQPFDADAIALKSAKNKKSKWYGMSDEDIKSAWKNEAKRATDLGTWYHNQRENDICGLDTIQKDGINIPVVIPEVDSTGVKKAPDQKLKDGIYPEHLVYLKSVGLCGQSDLVEVVNGKVYITDYKTNKEIKFESYTSWDGKKQKMSAPLSHVDDCNGMHYALQLSLYMYMILKHNHTLKPGEMVLHHVIFEEAGRDKFDNPIAALDNDSNPIVKEVIPYTVPYMKSEIITLINWLKENRDKIKKK
jgi:hypothetical protein